MDHPCTIVVLDEDERPGRYAGYVMAALQSLDAYRVLHVPLSQMESRLRELLELRGDWSASPHNRLIVTGSGQAANAAISCGLVLHADAIVCLSVSGQLRLDGINSLLNTGSAERSLTCLYLLSGCDCNSVSDTASEHAGIVSLRTNMPSVAIPFALRDSGYLKRIFEAIIRDEAVPSLDNLKEAWQSCFHYQLELDQDKLAQDGRGTFHISGWLSNTGRIPIEASTDGLRIGARFCEIDVREEPRAVLPDVVGPGERVPFQLTLPCGTSIGPLTVKIGLVCDGLLWLDEIGFPALEMKVGNDIAQSAPQPLHRRTVRLRPGPAPREIDASQPTMPDFRDRKTPHKADFNDLWYCYRLLLNRTPDSAGYLALLAMVQHGMTVEELVRRFLTSLEFSQLSNPRSLDSSEQLRFDASEAVALHEPTAAFARPPLGDEQRWSALEIVTALYQGLLGRKPDAKGLQIHTAELAASGIESIVQTFTNSVEFRNRTSREPGFIRFGFQGSMPVQSSCPDDELERLWQHIAEVWSTYGEEDPLWSVLTNERYHTSNKPNAEAVQGFYDSGKFDLGYLEAALSRAGRKPEDFATVAEYGCGVGRTTRWLAPRFSLVKAFDISRPHLRMAQEHLAANKCVNVELIHVRGRSNLETLRDIDLFFSVIVLQHNPPPIILDILRRAFEGLNAGGIAVFQVPTYCQGYKFNVNDYWREVAAQREMEMHFVPQAAVLDLAERCGLRALEVRPDHCIGNFDDWASSTFVLQKRC